MSEPRDDYIRPLAGAMMEVMGAMSALNMHPMPIPTESNPEDCHLSEVDHWAKHALEHLEAAVVQLSKLQVKIETMETHLALLGKLEYRED